MIGCYRHIRLVDIPTRIGNEAFDRCCCSFFSLALYLLTILAWTRFASGPGGLLISPTDGTTADSLVSNPTSLYPQQASSWSQRMTGFVSPAARIPALYVDTASSSVIIKLTRMFLQTPSGNPNELVTGKWTFAFKQPHHGQRHLSQWICIEQKRVSVPIRLSERFPEIPLQLEYATGSW